MASRQQCPGIKTTSVDSARLWPARLRLGRGRQALTRAGRAAAPPWLILPLRVSRRCDLPSWPSRTSQCNVAQCHSPRQSRQNRNIFQGVKFKASQPKLSQASYMPPAASGGESRGESSARPAAAPTTPAPGRGLPSGSPRRARFPRPTRNAASATRDTSQVYARAGDGATWSSHQQQTHRSLTGPSTWMAQTWSSRQRA